MSPKELFKAQMLERYIDAGCRSVSDVREMMEKQAGLLDVVTAPFSAGKSLVTNTSDTLKNLAILGLAATGAVGVTGYGSGALLGEVAGQAMRNDDVDTETAKQEELMDEYRRQATRLKDIAARSRKNYDVRVGAL